VYKKVKSTISHEECWWDAHLPYLGLEPVTHGQCDARPTVTFPVAGHRRIATGTKCYCLVTEAHACEQLAQGRYLTAERPGVELATCRVASQRLNHYTTWPHTALCVAPLTPPLILVSSSIRHGASYCTHPFSTTNDDR